MPTNSIEVQLQKAIEMKEKVQDFAKNLQLRMDSIRNTLDEYIRAGFPVDIADHYRSIYYEPDRESINGLCQSMLNEHVEYLEGLIKVFIKIRDRR